MLSHILGGDLWRIILECGLFLFVSVFNRVCICVLRYENLVRLAIDQVVLRHPCVKLIHALYRGDLYRRHMVVLGVFFFFRYGVIFGFVVLRGLGFSAG